MVQAGALVIVLPGALLCGFGQIAGAYLLFAQTLALLPGIVGSYLRCAFYRLTLRECSKDVTIWFGTYFSHPEARVGWNVSVGSYCVIGRAAIGEGTQISSHVQITSGRHEHYRDSQGRFTEGLAEQVVIGPYCWIGASATIMASVGARTTIGAGAVVVKEIPSDVVAVGNPARIVKSGRDSLHTSSERVSR
jgi:acetyltransferase-like isoleucine patch superfamily enzyme